MKTQSYNLKLKTLTVLGTIGYWLGFPAMARAQEKIGNPALAGTLQGLLGGESPGTAFLNLLIPNLITLFLVGITIAFFFMLLLGGAQWVMSGGDKTNIEKARGRVTMALVGIVIAFSAWAILGIIEIFFDITLTTFDIGALIIK